MHLCLEFWEMEHNFKKRVSAIKEKLYVCEKEREKTLTLNLIAAERETVLYIDIKHHLSTVFILKHNCEVSDFQTAQGITPQIAVIPILTV